MELYRNVHQIQSIYSGRNLFQYLFVSSNIVLVDTGINKTPKETILPYLERLKIKPERLHLAITTHADLDHQGGNSAIRRASPRAWLACGRRDRERIEDPQALYDLRYNFLMQDHGVGSDPEPSPDAGLPCKMDLCFVGGERIRLEDNWWLEVLHVPGHSHGHLALYDPKNKAAFVGDAIHGRGCPKAEGGLAIPVTYFYVDVYLSTLRYIEGLAIDVLYSGHWPNMRGEEVQDFIAESRRTVDFLDRIISSSLDKNPAGLTLKETIDLVANAVGDWPEESWIVAMYSVKGHLDRMEELGKARALRGVRPVKWVRA